MVTGERSIELGFENELVSGCVALALFLKQFYFGLSGTLQLGDIVLLLAAFVCIVQKGFAIEEEDKPFMVFLFFVIAINGLHSVLEGCFYSSSIFWIFNFIIIAFLFRPMLHVEGFLESVRFAFRTVLITQLILFISGTGTYGEEHKYMGTFNDPNQFSFYILCAMMGSYAIDVIQKKRTNWIWIIIAIFEMSLSLSSGMLLGTFLFVVSYLFIARAKDMIPQKIYLFILIGFLVVVSALIFQNFFLEILINMDNATLNRKLPKIANYGFWESYLKDRVLQRIVKAPWYFIVGSGEGNFERFRIIEEIPEGKVAFEMHSTMLALPYYYGIFPFCFVLMWLYYNLKNMSYRLFPVYFALIIEAFTLANHRQYVFWLLFMLAAHKDAKSAYHQA